MQQTVRRTVGLVQLGVRRLFAKLLHTERRRVLVSVSGVALAIAIMLIVTGVALGLSTRTTVGGEDVDYWIVPESRSASTLVADPGSTQFGNSHVASRSIEQFEDVQYASPVLIQTAQLQTTSDQREYVLLIGVVGHTKLEVAGLSAAAMTPGDPYYANGTYNGTWTGEVVISTAAGELLNASNGSSLRVVGSDRNRSLSVIAVAEGDVGTGLGQAPIAVMHLSELQQLTGATTYDQADQILVSTNSSAVKPKLRGVYPDAQVLTRQGLTRQNLNSELPLAMALSALVVGVVVGTLFIGTTMGLEVVADRRRFALMGALGMTGRSRAIIVMSQTVCVTLLGGLLGSALGMGGIALTNRLARQYVGIAGIARFDPILVGYSLLVAFGIGVLTAPYLLWLSNRATIIEGLER